MKKTVLLAGVLSAAMSLTVFAGQWQQDATGFWWQNDDGSYPVNSWQWLDGNQDGIAECYYFNESGYMLADTTAPDGYVVDTTGAWVVDGVVQTQKASNSNDRNNSNIWKQYSNGQWKVINPTKNMVQTNTWFCDDIIQENSNNRWYLLDKKGYLVTAGLVKDRVGNYFAIETAENGDQGLVRYQSGTYDGIYIEIKNDNNGLPPVIKNQEAIDALSSKYGVYEIDFGRDRSVFSSKFDKPNENITMAGYYADNTYDKQIAQSSLSQEEEQIIAAFKNQYITEGMSDFEKEMEIIKWLINHVRYDRENFEKNTVPKDCYSAYGALVNGVAVCQGYAEAFKAMAERCGLTTLVIQGTVQYTYQNWVGHAWNQIKLGDSWYHVDVTWVDLDREGVYEIQRRYINATDSGMRADHAWEQSSYYVCADTYYGEKAVDAYLNDGKVLNDSEIRASLDEKVQKQLGAWVKNGGYSLFTYSSIEATSNEIFELYCKIVDERRTETKLILHFPQYNANQDTAYQEVSGLTAQIESKVMEKLKEKYGNRITRKTLNFGFKGETAADGSYYIHYLSRVMPYK